MRHRSQDGSRLDRLPLVVGCAALAAFALLTAQVLEGGASAWDRTLFRYLYNGDSDWLDRGTPGQSDPVLNAAAPVFHVLADSRGLLLLVAAILVVLIVLRRGRAAAFFTVAVALTAAVPGLKQLVGRPSPFPQPHDPSFPSGHATLSMSIAACVVVFVRPGRWRWLAAALGAVLVLAVGIAVISDSGHWPSDVLAGWCLALAWVAVLYAVAGPWLESSAGRERAISAPHSHAPV
jgi:membrane-associated phospholipid phosphatase